MSWSRHVHTRMHADWRERTRQARQASAHCSSVRCESSMCLPAYDSRCRPTGMPLFACAPAASAPAQAGREASTSPSAAPSRCRQRGGCSAAGVPGGACKRSRLQIPAGWAKVWWDAGATRSKPAVHWQQRTMMTRRTSCTRIFGATSMRNGPPWCRPSASMHAPYSASLCCAPAGQA